MCDTIKPKILIQNERALKMRIRANQNLYFFRFVKEQYSLLVKNQE